MKLAKLILEDGSIFEGQSAGYPKSTAGEVVFSTGMTGYDLSLTDPSYSGQILTFTYPLIGNWGVPPKDHWESDRIQVSAVIISDLTTHPSHWQSLPTDRQGQKTLDTWLKEQKIPALVGIDTRELTQKLRERGVMLGKIIVDDNNIGFDDPNARNLVAEVSVNNVIIHNPIHSSLITHHSSLKIALLNCGSKRNIIRSLTARGATVYELPWNYDPFAQRIAGDTRGGSAWQDPQLNIDALVISNGPGDPKMAKESIDIIKKALTKKIPTFGICLGNQLLALAAGGDTYKLKFGHRAQNQPTIEAGTPPAGGRCYITTQNHGFTVDEKRLPQGFRRWFYNANDNTNEGMIHERLPFFSVQFHPEANPGPTDTEWLFDYFLDRVRKTT